MQSVFNTSNFAITERRGMVTVLHVRLITLTCILRSVCTVTTARADKQYNSDKHLLVVLNSWVPMGTILGNLPNQK